MACAGDAAAPTPAATASGTPSAISASPAAVSSTPPVAAATVPIATRIPATPAAVGTSPFATPVPILTVTPVPLATGASASPQIESDQQMAATWLRQNAVPLQSARSAAGFDDLPPLKALIGQARIVALGQSAYGARAFGAMQQRVVEFAVAQMGFNVIAANVDVADAGAIDAYIRGGDGPPALSGYAPVDWRSREMSDLMAWMRDFNQHHPPAAQLRLAGIGAEPPWQAIQSVENYLAGVDEAEDNAVAAGYACLTKFQFTPDDYARQPPMAQAECWDTLRTIAEELQARHDAYVGASSEAQFQQALADAAAVREGEEVLAGGDDVRERFMAEHVSKVLEDAGPYGRVLLLAHNDFVGERSSTQQTMGARLREQFGGLYVAIALDAELGKFTELPTPTSLPAYYTAPTPPGDSYEDLFQLAGLPAMLVPLRPGAEAPALPAWLAGPHPFRSMGERHDPGKSDPVSYGANLPAEFDALLYAHDPCPAAVTLYTYVEPTDTDFEAPCGTDWQLSSDQPGSYQSDYDGQIAHSGHGSLSLQSVRAAPGSAWVSQNAVAGAYRGKRVRLTAYVKTLNLAGAASLVLVLGMGPVQAGSVITQEAGLNEGSQDWQLATIEVDVPATAQSIAYGVALHGTGKLWLDELRLQILPAGQPTPLAATAPASLPGSASGDQRVGGLSPGSGQIDLVQGLAIFRMYNAAGPFSVVLKSAGGDVSERLFDENGSFNGATVFGVPHAGRYTLDVQASGAWTVLIEQAGATGAGGGAGRLPDTFTGNGQQVSAPFLLESRPIKFRLVYDGAGPFKVVLIDQAGLNWLTLESLDRSVVGHVDDIVSPFPPSGRGNYVLYVMASGAYTIFAGQ